MEQLNTGCRKADFCFTPRFLYVFQSSQRGCLIGGVYNSGEVIVFLSETWLKRESEAQGKTSGACGNLSVRNGNLSVRRRGTTDKICPIGKLLSGLTLRDSGDIFLDTGKIWRKSKQDHRKKRRNFKRSSRRKKNINWPSVRLSGSFALEILRGL